MDSPFLKEITKFLHERKNQRRWMLFFVCLAALVGVSTVTALKMIGQALTRKEKVLICDLQVHEHDKEKCYDDDKNLICGLADYVVHVHNDDCYDVDGNLVCKLPEIEPHEHTDKCWEEEEILVCTEEEAEGHQHDESCYETEQGELACDLEEHQHDDACYDEEGELICEEEEHQHEDDCYDEEEVLMCDQEEAEGHLHDDACYEKEQILTCGELELHTHDEDKCFDEDDKLTCMETVLEEHVHSDELGCFEIREAITETGLDPEPDPVVESEPQVFTTEESENDSDPEDVTATESTEDVDSVTEEAETEGSVTEEAGAEEAEMGSAEDVSATEPQDQQFTKTYTDEAYVVTATYNRKANIPEEAELVAEQITAESDSDHYAKREAEYKEILGDENASMQAIFKIGFYVDGKEVEPESPVNITIQFLDENGMPEGTPVTIVHYGDEGKEILDGGQMKDGATSFETNGFSEFLVGRGQNKNQPLDVKVSETGTEYLQLSHDFPYENEHFMINFHVEGEVKVPESIKTQSVSSTEPTAVGTTAEAAAAKDDTQPAADEVSDEEGETSTSEDEENAPGEQRIFTTESVEDEEASSEDQEVGEESTESGEDASGEEEGDVSDADNGDPSEDVSSGDNSSNDTTGSADDSGISTNEDLALQIKELDKNTDEYKAFESHTKEKVNVGALITLKPMAYELTYKGVKLDLTNCKVTADFHTTETLRKQAQQALVRTEEAATGTEVSQKDGNYELTIMVSELSADVTSQEVDDVGSINVSGDENESLSVEVKAEVFAAAATGQPNPKFTVEYYANLEKVAYNDDTLKVSVDGTNTNELPVIDTDGGKLPGNGKGANVSPNANDIRKLYVDTKTGKLKTKTELTEVYASRIYEYHKAPTINYINALIENASYELKEVWVFDSTKSSTSGGLVCGKSMDKDHKHEAACYKNNWVSYPYDEKLHFTNRKLSAGVEDGETYVYIADNAVVRLVYDTTQKDKDFEAAFYDYDIGDGKIYATLAEAQGESNGKPTSTQGTGSWYMRTGQLGINSAGNYSGSGAKLAFGNANTGSGLQHEQWSGNLLNKNNSTQGGHPSVAGSYKGCTFGLVEGLKGGKIQYSSGVTAPNLFSDGAATGKTAFDNNEYSLKFNRVGDTHTLTAVNGAGTNNLDSFNHPSPNSTTVHNHIWTNNFWPMDSASSYGANGHDMKFGDYGRRTNHQFSGQAGSGGGNAAATGTFPWSDDGKDHNSYFGMHYKVEFDLTADYVGPLEYYFFGDDDMWVFLGDGDGNGDLVCDIGGVHSSVGEYLNLWDYIDKEKEKIHRHTDTCYTNGEKEAPTCGYVDSKKFALNFFYTERGESGSTCWMQFTLPSVSSLTPETSDQDFGHLEVRKYVKMLLDGKEYPIEDLFDEGVEQREFVDNKEFTFKIKLEGANGKLKDDYAYFKYDKNGNVISGEGGILTWETIADGETFTLKDGEYIRIQYLPQGTTYTVTESNTEIQGVVYDSTDITGDDKRGEIKNESVSAEDLSGGSVLEIDGTVPVNNTSEVTYTNKYTLFALPKTGGFGSILYTIACLLCLFGAGSAGFLYRKKFRERRVQRSSKI